jgi:hypothetical protein
MPNEGPSLTKATYDKRRPRRNPPSSARIEAAHSEQKREAAESRRFHKLLNANPHGALRELGLAGEESKPSEPPIKRRKL